LEVLTQADFIKMSEDEAEWLFDSVSPQAISQKLPNSRGIFVTAGSKGCDYSINHLTGFVPAFKVDAIDTTGAGDSFVAACIHQLCQQDVSTIADAETATNIIKYAAAAGAIATMKPGAIDAQPTDAEVMKFLSIYSINL
jgi:fructokinase